MRHKLSTAALTAVSCLTLSPALSLAATITPSSTASTDGSPLVNPYTVSATDSINGLSPTASSGNFNQEHAAGVAVLTDGVFGTITRTPSDPAAPADPTATQTVRNASLATGGNTGGTSVTYTLPTNSNITSIATYGGWQDNGRDEQSYSVFVSSDGTTFGSTPIATVDVNPGSGGFGTNPGTNPSATSVLISDPSGTLASNVKAIRFDFNATENGYSGYTELDVFGSPVPEPTALSAVGIGALMLFRRRRGA